MKTLRWLGICFLLAAPCGPITAGQLLWTPGGDSPSLVLNLGDGSVKKTLEIPSGATTLRLTLKKFLLEDERLQITWTTDGALWMRQTKKMPGDETTEMVALPPGRLVAFEISTLSGTPVASIKLRRK